MFCKLDIKTIEDGSFIFRTEQSSANENVVQWQTEHGLRSTFEWESFRDNGFGDIVDRYEFILTTLMYYNERGVKSVSCDMLSWEDVGIVKAISSAEDVLDNLIETCS
jgi:hypothetical protein